MVTAKIQIEDTPKIKRQWLIAAGIVIALLAIAVLWYLRPNPQVAKVREMQKELFAKTPEKMTPEQRKEKFEAVRAEQEKLSTEERQELRKELSQQFQLKAATDALAYMKLTPTEKRKALDERIAREQAWQQKKSQGGSGVAGGQAGGGNPFGKPTAGGGETGGGAAGVPGGGPVGGGTYGKGPSTPEDRDNRRREMLIHTSAEARAAMDQMRLDMAIRRAQLGLPPAPVGKRPR